MTYPAGVQTVTLRLGSSFDSPPLHAGGIRHRRRLTNEPVGPTVQWG